MILLPWFILFCFRAIGHVDLHTGESTHQSSAAALLHLYTPYNIWAIGCCAINASSPPPDIIYFIIVIPTQTLWNHILVAARIR